jgi:hypothetical protein
VLSCGASVDRTRDAVSRAQRLRHPPLRLEDLLEQRSLARKLLLAEVASVEVGIEVQPELVAELDDRPDARATSASSEL